MLQLLRGKRLVFVGDSLNRNMWESLICILRNAVKNKHNVYEVNGRVNFRGEAAYSFVFEVSVELLCVLLFPYFCFDLLFFTSQSWFGISIGLSLLRGAFCVSILGSRRGND